MALFKSGSQLKAYVWQTISSLIRSKPAFVRRNALKQKRFLNVGCGKNIKPDFICLDYTWRPGIDVCWDITKPLPFDDAKIEGLFSEHCLEHISYSECNFALKEFFRILKPGGIVRIIVPDGGLYLDLYVKARNGQCVEFPYLGKVGKQDLAEDSRIKFTPMMAVNRVFRGYGHQFAYDYDTLAALLASAGFINVERVGFSRGARQELLIDSEYRAPQSLYIEAKKPHK